MLTKRKIVFVLGNMMKWLKKEINNWRWAWDYSYSPETKTSLSLAKEGMAIITMLSSITRHNSPWLSLWRSTVKKRVVTCCHLKNVASCKQPCLLQSGDRFGSSWLCSNLCITIHSDFTNKIFHTLQTPPYYSPLLWLHMISNCSYQGSRCHWKEQNFRDREEIEINVTKFLLTFQTGLCEKYFQQWKNCWENVSVQMVPTLK